jgi:hypothetical protein
METDNMTKVNSAKMMYGRAMAVAIGGVHCVVMANKDSDLRKIWRSLGFNFAGMDKSKNRNVILISQKKLPKESVKVKKS